MKNKFCMFTVFASLLGLPMLSSCDSGGGNNSDITLLSRGLNIQEINDNPTDLAKMPPSLADGETLEINFPAVMLGGEMLEAIDTTLTVQSSGQFIFGNARHSYIKSRTNELFAAVFRTEQLIDDDFQEELDNLLRVGAAGANGSLAEALVIRAGQIQDDGVLLTNEQMLTIRDAIRSLGYTARFNEDAFEIQVLQDQVLTLESTSMNSLLSGSFEIRGDVNIEFTWRNVLLVSQNVENIDGEEELASNQFTLELAAGSTQEERDGTFILTLKSLTEL